MEMRVGGDDVVRFWLPMQGALPMSCDVRYDAAASPYLPDRSKHQQETWLSLNVLGAGCVTGAAAATLVVMLCVVTCAIIYACIEPRWPDMFPVSTFPFTIATFFLGSLLSTYVGWNVAKYTFTLRTLTNLNDKAAMIAIGFAAGMRHADTPATKTIRYIMASLPFAIKHEMRSESTLSKAPGYGPGPLEMQKSCPPSKTCQWRCLTDGEMHRLRDLQCGAWEWARCNDLSSTAGLAVSLLPWTPELRIEALTGKAPVVSTLDVISFMYAKMDDAVKKTNVGVPVYTVAGNAIMQFTALYSDLRYTRNSRIPPAVINTMLCAIWAYLIWLPFALWGPFGWWTIVVHAMLSLFILGMLSAIANISNPFGRFDYSDVGQEARRAHARIWNAFNVALDKSSDVAADAPV